MNIDLDTKYTVMLDQIMKDTGLDQEDAIKYLISYYFKTQCSSNEVA